jgi:phosphatidylglycerophosphatase A
MKNYKPFLAKMVATLGFCGFFPKAPGTIGSLVALLLIYPALPILSSSDMNYILFATFLLGTISTDIYMKNTGHSDPKEVVIDEAFGLWLCLFINLYFANGLSNLVICLCSFVLFRFFDILKPFPISYIDKKMKNALGVMLDDALAGIFGSIIFILFSTIIFRVFGL